jgi:hypothetical protein
MPKEKFQKQGVRQKKFTIFVHEEDQVEKDWKLERKCSFQENLAKLFKLKTKIFYKLSSI